MYSNVGRPVLKICFGPPTAESKNLKNHVNFDVGDLFFRSPALWSSQNVFGPPTAGRVVVDFKDRDPNGYYRNGYYRKTWTSEITKRLTKCLTQRLQPAQNF